MSSLAYLISSLCLHFEFAAYQRTCCGRLFLVNHMMSPSEVPVRTKPNRLEPRRPTPAYITKAWNKLQTNV